MNYFHLDSNIKINAQSLHDAHVRKMSVETAQMLSTGIWINDRHRAERLWQSGSLMKPAHINAGQCKWAAMNMGYLTAYFYELLDEYEHRFGSRIDIEYIVPSLPEPEPDAHAVPWYFMPYECRVRGSVIKSYRRYYNEYKKFDRGGNRIDTYTNRQRPEWFLY